MEVTRSALYCEIDGWVDRLIRACLFDLMVFGKKY
jgi:hypothetical protein